MHTTEFFNPGRISARRRVNSFHQRHSSVPLIDIVDEAQPEAWSSRWWRRRRRRVGRGGADYPHLDEFASLHDELVSDDGERQDVGSDADAEETLRPRPRGFRDLMLSRIPSNWAELCGFLVFMAIFNIVFRFMVAVSGLPRDQNRWSTAQMINNFSMLLHYSSTAYMLGTIALTDVLTFFYIGFMLVSAVIFTMLGTLSFFHASISANSMRLWTPFTIAGFAGAGVLVVSCVMYQVLLAARYSKAYVAAYLGSLLATVGLHVWLFRVLEDGVHLHHWYLCWVFLLFLRARTRFSIMSHAVVCGVFQQGIAAYGCAPVLYNSALV